MRIPIALTGAALLVALAGCATTTGATPSAAQAAAPAPAATHADAVADGTPSHPFAFGATHHGQSLDVTISAPHAFTPSDTAFTDAKGGKAVYVTITLSNHSPNQSINPLGEVTINASAGTSAVEDVEDDANGVGEPESDILPGHTLTWKHGFNIPTDAKDLTVTIGTLAADGGINYTGPIG
jgi:hypothetical protein